MRHSPNARRHSHPRAKVPEPDREQRSDPVRIRSWPFWILVVVMVSGPWYGLVREPQWARVTWIPFHGYRGQAARHDPELSAVSSVRLVVRQIPARRDRDSAGDDGGGRGFAGGRNSAAVLPAAGSLRDRSPHGDLRHRRGSVASQTFYRRDARGAARGGEAGERRPRAGAGPPSPRRGVVVRVSKSTACSKPRDNCATNRPTTMPASARPSPCLVTRRASAPGCAPSASRMASSRRRSLTTQASSP